MPTIVPEPADTLFEESDWMEYMETTQPGGGDILSVQRSEAVLVGLIPARKRRSAAQFFLGYSYADDAAPWELHRVAPVRHPHYPYLWCTAVRFQQTTPIRNDSDPDGEGYPKREAAEPGGPLAAEANYSMAYATLTFSQLPYFIADDDEAAGVLDEWERYTTVWQSIDPTLETLNVETGPNVRFAEGPADNPNGKTFQAAITDYKQLTNYRLKWHMVPESYVLRDNVPAKIAAGVGCVNSADFLGLTKQTALMLPPVFERYQTPVRTLGTEGYYCVDVTLNFCVFDPSAGYGVGTPLANGWQRFPWYRGSTNAGGPGWYTVQRADGTYYLPEYDFTKLFEHASKP